MNNPSIKYPAKNGYKNKSTASKYDKSRFASYRGRTYVQLERKSFQHCFKRYPRAKNVLDMACGTGRVTEWLAEQGYKVTGADISQEMLEKAEERVKKYTDVRFVVADAENLPFEDGEFDFAVSSKFMGHLPPEVRVRVLKELNRVTKEAVILSMPVYTIIYKFRVFFKTNIKKTPIFWHPVTKEALAKEANKSGLKIAGKKRIAWPFSPTTIVVLERAC